jgi:cytochrome c553
MERNFARLLMCAFAVAGASISQGAVAQQKATPPDPAMGQQIAGNVCAACHSADGNSTVAANPRLAGQSAEYLIKQLTDLAKPAGDKNGRENPVMSAVAMTLSDEDRRNVAAWFASQAPKPSLARDKDSADLGERIYRSGIPEKALPACAGCHGPTGAGLPSLYPRIGGQFSEYLVAQLKAFRDGTRRNNVPMEQIAPRLSETEMAAVADFAAGLRAK